MASLKFVFDKVDWKTAVSWPSWVAYVVWIFFIVQCVSRLIRSWTWTLCAWEFQQLAEVSSEERRFCIMMLSLEVLLLRIAWAGLQDFVAGAVLCGYWSDVQISCTQTSLPANLVCDPPHHHHHHHHHHPKQPKRSLDLGLVKNCFAVSLLQLAASLQSCLWTPAYVDLTNDAWKPYKIRVEAPN